MQMKHHETGQVFTTADALSEFLLVPVFTGRLRGSTRPGAIPMPSLADWVSGVTTNTQILSKSRRERSLGDHVWGLDEIAGLA